MLLSGELIDARRALDWGLVNAVVPQALLDDEVNRWCGVVTSKSAAVVALGKQAFYRQIEQDLETAYRATGETMACNLAYEDAAEGIDAFLGKRKAAWRGR